MMELAFGAGSVPCKQQHTMSMEIELARPTTQAGTCLPSRVHCSVFWSPSSPWQFFADEKSNRGLNGSEGICVSSAVSALSPVQQFFEFFRNARRQRLEKQVMHTEPSAKSGNLTRFDRIVFHLRCLYRDHKYRWHWAGVWRELRPVH